MNNFRQKLQSFALFGGVDDTDMPVIEALLKTERYGPGDYLCHQGEPGDRLFLIIEGTVEILSEETAGTTARSTRIALRGPGDSIGEMTLIDIQNRSASVRACESVIVKSLSYWALQRLYQSHQALFTLIIMNIAREISRRLRSMNTLYCSSLYGEGLKNNASEQ